MPKEIDRDEVQRLLAEGAQLVEVLPREEFEEEHLPGAINMPLRRLESMGFTQVHDYVAGKLDWLAAGLPSEGPMARLPRAGDVARKDVPTCEMAERLGDVRERVRAAGWNVCVVVNEERIVLGLLRQRELDGDADLTIERAMRPGPSTFRPHVGIQEMASFMVEHGQESSPITTSEGLLIGILFREDAEREAHRIHELLHQHHGDEESGHAG